MKYITIKLLVLLLVINPVLADCSITDIKLIAPPEKVIASTTIAIPVLIEADSVCTVDELRFSSIGQNTGTRLIIFDPPGGVFQNFSVSGSTTKVFIVRTNSIDTFLYNIDLHKGGTNLSVSGSADFLDPSLLSVTGPTDIVASERFNFIVEIKNPQVYTLTTYYSLSYDSIFLLTGGDPLSDTIKLAPGETRTLRWAMNISEDYEYGSGDIKFQNGNAYDAVSITASFCPPEQKACEGICHSETGLCCDKKWIADVNVCPTSGGEEGSSGSGGASGSEGSGGGDNESEEYGNYTEEGITTTTITKTSQQEEKTTSNERTWEEVDLTYIIVQMLPFIIIIIILIGMMLYIYRKYKGRMFEKMKW